MRLTLRCTGGYTGPAGAQTRTVDLAQLPPPQAAALQKLIQATDFFALPPTLTKSAPQSWDFQYDLEVCEDGKQPHCVRYHLDEAPPALKKLTEKINETDPD